MANFTETQKTQVRRLLGYSNVDAMGTQSISVTTLNTRLAQDYDVSFIDAVQLLITNIEEIEAQQKAAIAKSRIVKADVITFDYGSQTRLLTQQGNAYIQELSALIGVGILFNKFSAGAGVSQTSLRSY
jgi:hypothetical protein